VLFIETNRASDCRKFGVRLPSYGGRESQVVDLQIKI
jgi:hypothetical protein